MALQIAKRAVVGQHVESVSRPLEGATGPVPPVGAFADVGAKHAGALVVGQALRARPSTDRRAEQTTAYNAAATTFSSPSGSKSDSVTSARGSGSAPRSNSAARPAVASRAVGQIARPALAPLGLIHANQEGGNHLAKLAQHLGGAGARLLERMCAHAQQQRFECLSGSVQSRRSTAWQRGAVRAAYPGPWRESPPDAPLRSPRRRVGWRRAKCSCMRGIHAA